MHNGIKISIQMYSSPEVIMIVISNYLNEEIYFEKICKCIKLLRESVFLNKELN